MKRKPLVFFGVSLVFFQKKQGLEGQGYGVVSEGVFAESLQKFCR